MTFDEILFLFIMPIVLFYLIQVVLLAEFWHLANEMLHGRKTVSLLCEYDSCLRDNRASCLSDQGKREMKSRNPILFKIPAECQEDIDNLRDHRSLNPFRRIREDFVVLVASIFFTVLFFNTFDIITIPKHLSENFMGLYISSILSLFFMGYIYKPDRDDLVVLIAGVHACIGFILFWYLRAFDVSWDKFPLLAANQFLVWVTNNFSLEMPTFLLIFIWVITGLTTLSWRIWVPNN